jgi:hypothetical protein
MADPIRITGLREFTRAMKDLDADLPKVIRTSLNDALGLVIGYAQPRVERRSGRAAASIRGASTGRSARIRAGGKRAPYYGWLDFGGRVGAQRQVKRPFYREGRYLYKGLVVKRLELTAAMEKALVGVAESAGVDVD